MIISKLDLNWIQRPSLSLFVRLINVYFVFILSLPLMIIITFMVLNRNDRRPRSTEKSAISCCTVPKTGSPNFISPFRTNSISIL